MGRLCYEASVYVLIDPCSAVSIPERGVIVWLSGMVPWYRKSGMGCVWLVSDGGRDW